MADDLGSEFRAFSNGEVKDQAHANLLISRDLKPDEAAKVKALADRWGVGIDTAQAQQPMLERQARTQADNDALADAPKIAAFLAQDKVNAAVSHDSVGDMARVEALVRKGYPTFGPIKGPKPTLLSYLKGLGTDLLAGGTMTKEAVNQYIYDSFGLTEASRHASQRFSDAQFRTEVAKPAFKSWLAGSVYGGVSSLLQTAPAVAASVALRNPAPALTVMGAQTGLQTYGEVKGRGGTPLQALGAGAGTGTIEAATELLPMGFLVKRFGKTGFKAFVAGFAGRELAGEELATFTQDAVDTAVANPDKTWAEYWKERPQAAADTAVGVAVNALAFGGAHKLASHIARQDTAAQSAKPNAEQFNEIVKETAALPLRERAPAQFHALMDKLAEGMDIHVNAVALDTYLQSLDPQEAWGLIQSLGIEGQLAAATPEADIVIKGSDYLTHIGPTDGHKALEKDIKIGSAGMSINEAQVFNQDREAMLSEAAAKALSGGTEAANAEAPKEMVRQHAYELALAGGRPEAEAQAYAAIQASHAEARAARGTQFKDAWAAYSETNPSLQKGSTTVAGPAGDQGAAGTTFDQAISVALSDRYRAENKITTPRLTAMANPDEKVMQGIADAYENAKHDPQHPATRAAYEALARETMAQFELMGEVKVEAWDASKGEPYKSSAEMVHDALLNKHLWFYPTEAATFGSTGELDASNPMLADTGKTDVNGKPLLVNDVFRIVHDFFGHTQSNLKFGPKGELNAFLEHAGMYSKDALPALAAETLMQNAWVNYGQHMRNAEGVVPQKGTPGYVPIPDRKFADQKAFAAPKSVINAAFKLGNQPPLQQGPRGNVSFSDQGALIRLFKTANASTLIHEGAGHVWLEELARDAAYPGTDEVQADFAKIKSWWHEHLDGLPASAEIAPGINEARARAAIDNFGAGEPDTEAIRPFHEMFARAAERYFMEGKAPSEELRGPFAKFRNWLVSIYKELTRLRVPMTDEMRGVFDRLVAVPEAIETAKAIAALEPFFKDPEQAGMTPAEFEAYLRTLQLADETAHDRLLGKVMGDIRRQRTAEWKSERETLVNEFADEVNATPQMQALTLLENGARLNRQALIDAGIDEDNLYRRSRKYVFNDGVPPDVIAEQAGLSSGEALLDLLQELKTEHDNLRGLGDKRTVRQARIEDLADAEMLARHGDILNDGTIGEEAMAAINELRRSEVLMAEIRSLVRKAGATTLVWSPEEMEAWAVAQISSRRLEMVRPHVYAAAEGKAGRDALKALVKDDFQGALDAKFRQLLNQHLYRAARDAREDIEKGKRLFDRIAHARNGSIAKTRNMDMVETARAILTPYGFEGGKNDADYMTKVAEYDPELWADIEPTVTAALAGAKDIDELTYDEFRSLRDVVSQLWIMSRASRQMEIDFQALELEDVVAELGEQLDRNGVPERPWAGRAPTPQEVNIRGISGLRAQLRRVESWASYTDNGPKGVFRTYIWQPISDASTHYRVAKADHLTKFLALLKPVSSTLKRGKIEAKELNYVFGHANNGVGKSELLHAILHTGNESNKRKLLLGRGWATENVDGSLETSRWDAFTTRMQAEGTLTKDDYDFAQSVWDLLDAMKPDAQKAHRQVFGRYFEEVTANKFVTPFGEYRGGYVPAIVDTFLTQEQALKQAAEAAVTDNDTNMFPTPNRGFTKSRVDYNRPLALDLGLLPSHIDKVLKFTHMAAPVRDVLRLLKEKDFANKLAAYDPVAVPVMLMPWLTRASRQTIEVPSNDVGGRQADNFWRAVRSRTGMGIMIGNVSNTLQQFTGWAPAASRVKKRHLVAALWRYVRNPDEMATDVSDMSPYMATRVNPIIHEIGAQIETLMLDPTAYEKTDEFVRRHAYVMQAGTQHVVDLVTWHAAFEGRIEQGDDYTEAVRYADSAVRETQGSLAPEDVSAFESGTAFKRMFTQFYNYFGNQSNLYTSTVANAIKDKAYGRAIYAHLMILTVPAVLSGLITKTFGIGWDDEGEDGYWDDLLRLFFGSQFTYAAAFVPVVGQIANLAVNRFDDKQYNDRIVVSPALTAFESVAGIPVDLQKLVAEGKNQKSTVRDVATLMTLVTGIPLFSLAARPLGYLADVNEGKVTPTSPADFARGLVTGTASKASRNQ